MTHDEKDMRIEALEVIYIAKNHSIERAEAMLAERLTAWRDRIRERDANVCLNIAKDWRTNPMATPVDEVCRSLRERSAEAAESCARRIDPRTEAKP